MATTCVALLRAVNLGARNKVAMAGLRALLEDLGYGGVRTHLNSGNAVFSVPRGGPRQVERAVAARIESDLGPAVAVMVRTAAEMSALVEANPFADADPKQLHAVFLATAPAKEPALDPRAYAPDEFAMGDRVVYLRLPNGVAGARLPDWGRVLGVPATMRTWNVVTRLRDLANG